MQYSIATAISTILFASSLTSAGVIPRQAANDVFIQLKTGDGDASVGRDIATADFGRILSQDSNGASFKGVAASTSSAGVKCGVFNPQTGASLNGLTFDSTSDAAVFGNGQSNGGTGSNLADAINVGICCDVSNKFATTCGGQNGNDNGNGNGNAQQGNQGASFPVEMLFRGLSELARPETVIADGKPHPVRGAVGIQEIIITKTHKAVQCEAFTDAQGNNKVGNTFDVKKTGRDFTNFEFQQGVDIETVACQVIA